MSRLSKLELKLHEIDRIVRGSRSPFILNTNYGLTDRMNRMEGNLRALMKHLGVETKNIPEHIEIVEAAKDKESA